ncbi:hypothetical protein FCT18_19550 [Lysinibacillus sphaericus]|uniref:Uncharacterized protein n=1 Tax=Lysinibacillus sphaericus TaxID=1421 RepID=A0A2S0K3F9_LYSSH|nr:hypothetical protein [Lysinibacillus sphaericus]AVK97881.1 hypothetical protein LS41612_17130 [Lysinibacillus sphaericus]MED4543376.1 hypothetical protein [Lysinibacillus sphaericus]TKI16837.1 hypothetical protein FCT18_19550 [Lysinibacillus sphaericus]SUV16186.1 Uncharacterised protein [Lysinibacillus sphaericus]GEC84246.1 hypothetical protein LSP03_39890 [Lysinibacillus sphaericus]
MCKRQVFFTISIMIIIIAGISLWINERRTAVPSVYYATDVLENANFNAKNQFVNIESIILRPEIKFTSLKIPEETQQELIQAFKNAKFKKVEHLSSIRYRYNYRVNITLNTGYVMFMDSNTKFLQLDDTGVAYIIEDDDNRFFDILEKATIEKS